MIRIRLFAACASLAALQACGGDENLLYECDDRKGYLAVNEGKRVEVPEGLDPLNEFAEMPIPRPENAPPPSQRCIELPPSVRVKTLEDNDVAENEDEDEVEESSE